MEDKRQEYDNNSTDINPEFNQSARKHRQEEERQNAREGLGAMEENSSFSNPKFGEKGSDMYKSEMATSQNSFYKGGSVGAANAAINATEKITGKKVGKGKSAIIIALFSILGIGGGIFNMAQSLMPFSTIGRLVQEFNSLKIVNNKRSDRFLKYNLDTERYKSPTKKTIFNNDKFTLSKKQKKKLKAQGIEEVKLSGRRVLVYDDGSGKKTVVTTNSDNKKIQKGKLSEADLISDVKTKMGGDIEFNSKAISIDNAFELENFKYGYLKSSKTWKGNYSSWFDGMVIKTLTRLGIKRNRFAKWREHDNVEAGNKAFKEAAAAGEEDFKEENKSTQTREEEDENGNKTKIEEDLDGTVDPEGNKIEGINTNDDDVSSKKTKQQKMESVKSKVAKVAQSASSVVCGVYQASTAITAIVVAHQVAQILNFVSGYFEAINKVQAGDGSASPMNYYANMLTEPDENGKSGMTSAGMAGVFGNIGGINKDDPSVQKYNPNNISSSFFAAAATSGDMSLSDYKKCSYAKAVAGAVGATVDAISAAVAITTGAFTFGIGTLVTAGVKIAAEAAISAAISAAIGAIVSQLVEGIADMLMEDVLENATGEDIGNIVVTGATKYMGGNHQSGGGSPGSEKKVLAFKREAEAILAEEAEYDRATHSPFDYTNQNTFLGSIVYGAMQYSTASTFTSTISVLANQAAQSVVKLLPSASAVAETRMIANKGDCPELEDIGAMGDAYCNPYYTTDLKTIDDDPGDLFATVLHKNSETKVISRKLNSAEGETCYDHTDANGVKWYHYEGSTNFAIPDSESEYTNKETPTLCIIDVLKSEDDNPLINMDSALGKYILFCSQRSSRFGSVDASIQDKLNSFTIKTGNNTADSVLEGFVGAIPIVGDTKDIAEGLKDVSNAKWVVGASCVANDENETGTNDDWPENKLYQRYMEDQRLLENEGLVEKSAVVSALDEYYEKNPLDQSEEGIIARLSGLTKEQVIATEDLIDELLFLADYNPTHKFPTPAPVIDNKISLTTNDETSTDRYSTVSNYVPSEKYIIYDELRYKNYAV